MSNTIVSLIRTYVPVAVGALISWLVAKGIDIPEDAQTGITVALTAIVIAIYYSLARLLERKWPFFGVLLGSQTQPVYQPVSTKAQLEKTA